MLKHNGPVFQPDIFCTRVSDNEIYLVIRGVKGVIDYALILRQVATILYFHNDTDFIYLKDRKSSRLHNQSINKRFNECRNDK